MKELVKPIKKENQFKSVELYDECVNGNYCGEYNHKTYCDGNYCGYFNYNSSEEDDILF